MNTITHFLASWALADATDLDERDRTAVAWAGAAPDLDGLGAIPDIAAKLMGWTDPGFFGRWHHVLLHGLFGSLAISAAAAFFARRRRAAFLWSFAAVHLHFLCDFAGSRGPTADQVWPIPYLGPFSERLTLAWPGQWELNAWPNIAITLALLAWAFHRAATRERSPLECVNRKAHEGFVKTVKTRLGR